MEKRLFAIVLWAHFFISPGWDESTFGTAAFQTLSLSCFSFFFMDCPDRGVNIVLYWREHQYVKYAGRRKIIFIFSLCCATNKLWEKWARNWFHLNCGWRRAFHPSLRANPVWFFWKCHYPPKFVPAFLIGIAFAYHNAQYTVFCILLAQIDLGEQSGSIH